MKVPGEVYYRCVWLIRDRDRLEEIASFSKTKPEQDRSEKAPPGEGLNYVSEAACERAAEELMCIDSALIKVPEAYRQGVLENISLKKPFSDLAHPNTWKKWKQVFIYELALELHLI